jgi:hypothetical protein
MSINPLAHHSADEIVKQHSVSGANSHFVSEMLRRLMMQLATQGTATDALTNRIWWLNMWLLIVTIAIFLLTVVLVVDAVWLHRR